MNAGRLRYRVSLWGVFSRQSDTGFVQEQEVLLLECSADIQKQMMSYDKDGLQAREFFHGETIVFRVRNTRLLVQARELGFRGERYKIVMQQPERDNSMLLYCRKRDQ